MQVQQRKTPLIWLTFSSEKPSALLLLVMTHLVKDRLERELLHVDQAEVAIGLVGRTSHSRHDRMSTLVGIDT